MRSRQPAMLKQLRVIAAFFFVAPVLAAQTPAVPARITAAIEDANRVTLRGNVHPYARPQYDQGLVADSLPLERMLLVLRRSAEQQAALTALLAQQQNPSSPQYHQWLTPAQFGQLFGPAAADIASITAWLSSQGFRVNGVSPGRMVIDFSGTAGQVRSAFRTEIHRYVVNGQEHWANATDPQIPAALAPVVVGVNSLHNFPLTPMHRTFGAFAKSRTTGEIKPIAPSFSFSGCGATCNDLGPYDFAAIYNVLPLWNSGIDGTGQVIAIAQNTNLNLQDVRNFRALFGLPANDPRIIVNGADPGITDPDSEMEADLDVQWSGAVAKNAAVDLVVSASGATDGAILSAQYVLDNNFASIMSLSFGQCELFIGAAGNQGVNQLWQQAAALGITVTVASADQGSATCDFDVPFATNGLAVNGLASTPYNVAVGGTDFNDFLNANQFWNFTNTATTQSSAKGYIPETSWNDSCTNGQLTLFGFSSNPETNCNNPQLQQFGLLSVTGGGGGASNCTAPTGVTPSTCAGGYPKPTWQTGTGVPNDGVRDLPDVSLFAGNGFAGSAYIVCQSDQDPGGQACNLNSPYVDFMAVGGTSAASPAFAGIMAMVNQKTGSRQGNANPILYQLAAGAGASCTSSATPGGSCIFNDVVVGTNAMPCLSGSPNCTVSTSSDPIGVLSGYNTTAGFDLATGLGSVNATNLVNDWPVPGSGSAIANFQLLASSLTISVSAPGQAGSANVTVTSVGGFSGTVTLNCAVSPVAATNPPTCAFNPNFAIVNGSTPSATVTLQISSTAPQTTSALAGDHVAGGRGTGFHTAGNYVTRPTFLAATGVILLGSMFLFAGWQKRPRAILLALASIAFLAAAGCSSSGNGAPTTTVVNPGTPAGSYVVTITGTSENLKQTTNVFVTIP
jgi:subtilase family serine protease